MLSRTQIDGEDNGFPYKWKLRISETRYQAHQILAMYKVEKHENNKYANRIDGKESNK